MRSIRSVAPIVVAAWVAALVAGWYRFGEKSRPWGNDIPPILVLCPAPEREDVTNTSGNAAGCLASAAVVSVMILSNSVFFT